MLYGSDLSLQMPVSSDSDKSLGDSMECPAKTVEKTVESKDLYSKLHGILEREKAHLSPRENLILFKRLMSDSPLTLQDVGDSLDISRERVRQLEGKLISKLREIFFRELGENEGWAF